MDASSATHAGLSKKTGIRFVMLLGILFADMTCAPRRLPQAFWIYSAGTALIAAGYADFSLIAYHVGKTDVVTVPWMPIFYAVAMISAAVAALWLGRLFDAVGIKVMIPATVASAISAPLAFLGAPAVATVGILCWGSEWARRSR